MTRWMIPVAMLVACGGNGPDTSDTDRTTTIDTDLPLVYAFTSRFDGEDSVSNSGQAFRNLLIADMKTHLGGVTGRIETGDIFPVDGEIDGEMEFYCDFDSSTSGDLPHLFSASPSTLQLTYNDVSSDKNLEEKIAGADEIGQHVDWNTAFIGWGEPGSTSPLALIDDWSERVDQQAVDFSNGNPPLDPDGVPVPAVYLTPEGQDLQQLLEKFLRGSIAFSQGADDYLDDDTPGKGLLADHTVAEEGKNYTALEHAWDEGFGYFGAARDYAQWTDDEIADVGTFDADGDGHIDLKTEVTWGHAVNAAKRDRGSADTAPNDFTADAWEGFARGRQLLANTDGALTDDQMTELQMWRDQAVESWEKAIASTAVHYINDVLQDMSAMDTDDYDFAGHAKHWSELKGFALSLQFNPRSPVTDGDFAALHDLLGTAPVLETAPIEDRDAYAEALLDAKDILRTSYGFDAANMGDDVGEGGW